MKRRDHKVTAAADPEEDENSKSMKYIYIYIHTKCINSGVTHKSLASSKW